MKFQEVEDLNKLAVMRCREAFLSVAQLMDDDTAIAAMMLTVIHDFMETAGTGLAMMKGVSKEEGLAKAAIIISSSLGARSLDAMVKEMRNE